MYLEFKSLIYNYVTPVKTVKSRLVTAPPSSRYAPCLGNHRAPLHEEYPWPGLWTELLYGATEE